MRSGRFHRGIGSGYLRNSFNPCEPPYKKRNKILLLLNVLAVSLDPLFFYVRVIKDDKKCHGLDKKLMFTAIVLRTFTDICDISNIIFQFYNGFTAAKRYLYPSFIIDILLYPSFIVDILAVLPIPQVVILIVIPNMRGSRNFRNLLIFFVIFQYVPRLLRTYPLYKKVKKTSSILTGTAWTKAAFNLFLFMLASHVLGASWYFFSIERETACWQKACRSHTGCIPGSFYCDGSLGNNNFLNEFCPIKTPNATIFDFGIFLDALQSGIVESTDFPEKFFHCFWWGLRNLSSFGQNLNTSRFVWENCFAVLITISGLVLFISFIGNMQIYLQSKTIRQEEMRLKGQDIEKWMSSRLLSENLQKQVRSYQHYKWRKTRGVDIENFLGDLPRDLRMNIKRELCLDLIKRVPLIERMNAQKMDEMCEHLRLELYPEKCYIVREGDPVKHMLFVMQGELVSWTRDGGRSGSVLLKEGDFCGGELLEWALDPHSSPNMPTSTRTVQALVEVEAFAVDADDLKIILSQHHPPLQQTLAACCIQAAWRRHTGRVQEKRFRPARLPSGLGAATYASHFAANALRGLRLRRGTLLPVVKNGSDALLATMV